MPESAAIDEALVDLLQGDATLTGLMPDGVYWDAGPPNATRLVIVALVSQVDTPSFDGRAFEEATYRVKAVALSKVANANTDVRAAANRIDALLERGTLTAAGYDLMVMQRVGERIHTTEVDDLDPSIRWYHRGGEYQVTMSGT
jgi:hypothetical protein